MLPVDPSAPYEWPRPNKRRMQGSCYVSNWVTLRPVHDICAPERGCLGTCPRHVVCTTQVTHDRDHCGLSHVPYKYFEHRKTGLLDGTYLQAMPRELYQLLASYITGQWGRGMEVITELEPQDCEPPCRKYVCFGAKDDPLL